LEKILYEVTGRALYYISIVKSFGEKHSMKFNEMIVKKKFFFTLAQKAKYL